MQWIKNVACVLALTITLNASLANAQDCSECESLLKESVEVIDKKNETIELKNLAIKERDAIITFQLEQIQDLEKSNARFYKNPFIMMTVGALIGILVTGVALK